MKNLLLACSAEKGFLVFLCSLALGESAFLFLSSSSESEEEEFVLLFRSFFLLRFFLGFAVRHPSVFELSVEVGAVTTTFSSAFSSASPGAVGALDDSSDSSGNRLWGWVIDQAGQKVLLLVKDLRDWACQPNLQGWSLRSCFGDTGDLSFDLEVFEKLLNHVWVGHHVEGLETSCRSVSWFVASANRNSDFMVHTVNDILSWGLQEHNIMIQVIWIFLLIFAKLPKIVDDKLIVAGEITIAVMSDEVEEVFLVNDCLLTKGVSLSQNLQIAEVEAIEEGFEFVV